MSRESSTTTVPILCSVSTLAGNPCTRVPLVDLPCCSDHACHWATANFDNLRRFVTPRADQIGRIYVDPDGRIAVHVRKKIGASVKPRTRWRDEPGFTGLHLDVDTATICADLLASLGNDKAAEIILSATKKPLC